RSSSPSTGSGSQRRVYAGDSLRQHGPAPAAEGRAALLPGVCRDDEVAEAQVLKGITRWNAAPHRHRSRTTRASRRAALNYSDNVGTLFGRSARRWGTSVSEWK